MTNRNTWTTRAAAVAIGAMVLAGCGDRTDPRGGGGRGNKLMIAYVGYSSSTPFWITLKNGGAAKAGELGVDFLDLTAAKPEMDQQRLAISNAILKKVDGLVIGPVDSRGLKASFDKARQAGIPVVTVDTRVDHPAVRSHVATDNVAAAKLAGEYIVKRLGGKGKVLILGGITGSQTADDRRNGVEKLCKAAGMTVIFRPADWDEAKANQITQNELGANPDLAAIFAACDPMIITAKQAVKAKGMLGKVVLVGFDAIPACLKAVRAGEVDATIRQDPARMGREGVELMVKLLGGEQIPPAVPIAAVVIDKNNVEEYLGK